MKKSIHRLSRQTAIVFAVLTVFMSIVFLSIYNTSTSVNKTETVSVVSAFDSYEFQFGRHFSLNYALLSLESGEQLSVLGVCVNAELQSAIEEMKKGTSLQALVSTDTNIVVELKADGEEILNFDYAQKKLRQEGVGFMYLAIFMLVLCGYFIHNAMTAKEKITKSDLKFFWDIMRGK